MVFWEYRFLEKYLLAVDDDLQERGGINGLGEKNGMCKIYTFGSNNKYSLFGFSLVYQELFNLETPGSCRLCY